MVVQMRFAIGCQSASSDSGVPGLALLEADGRAPGLPVAVLIAADNQLRPSSRCRSPASGSRNHRAALYCRQVGSIAADICIAV